MEAQHIFALLTAATATRTTAQQHYPQLYHPHHTYILEKTLTETTPLKAVL